MNITPLEIRQKVFEKNFRGYDKDEVTAFLTSLSVEWEKLQDQTKELKYKLESAEKEVQKLREVENSLFKTLKTAEDTGANMIEHATKTADLHMKETEMKADALMSEAKSRAKNIIEDAENKASTIVDDMEDEIRQLEQVFKSLSANKESMMSELKMLTADILDKIKRHEEFPADIKPILKEAKKFSREVNETPRGGEEKKVHEILAPKTPEKIAAAPVEEEKEEEPIDENLTNLDLADVADEHEKEANESAEGFLGVDLKKEKEPQKEEAPSVDKKGSFFDRVD
ncbi:DivIVA domain-containing protein [uncultured Roseivirga sp.]|uniref:DivIVA domain-containing protein n=1 Tax=uncultured Roseivirga sp. TaxID=543088 RepID=UPI0030D7108C|tara:strand:+ start:5780 stop:6634 length:855 start_codon:yes stop_codon:yes gene_type:complete